eukprot:3273416-Pyramimonas_sp.AAC.1
MDVMIALPRDIQPIDRQRRITDHLQSRNVTACIPADGSTADCAWLLSGWLFPWAWLFPVCREALFQWPHREQTVG